MFATIFLFRSTIYSKEPSIPLPVPPGLPESHADSEPSGVCDVACSGSVGPVTSPFQMTSSTLSGHTTTYQLSLMVAHSNLLGYFYYYFIIYFYNFDLFNI